MRARHRAMMALRWRDLEARADDKAHGRLPIDWHAWMGCPAYDPLQKPHDGYKQGGCICDVPLRNSPKQQREDTRAQRAMLIAHLRRPDAADRLSSGPRQGSALPVGVEWVETIDSTPESVILNPHTSVHAPRTPTRSSSRRSILQVGEPVQHQPSKAASHAGERWWNKRQPPRPIRAPRRAATGGQQSRSLRIPSWVCGIRRVLSRLSVTRSTSRGVG